MLLGWGWHLAPGSDTLIVVRDFWVSWQGMESAARKAITCFSPEGVENRSLWLALVTGWREVAAAAGSG